MDMQKPQNMGVKAPGKVRKPYKKNTAVVQCERPIPNRPEPKTRPSKLIPLGGKKFATVRKYNGELKVNIRNYLYDVQGKMYSTKNGVMLTTVEWEQLKKTINDIDNSLALRQPIPE